LTTEAPMAFGRELGTGGCLAFLGGGIIRLILILKDIKRGSKLRRVVKTLFVKYLLFVLSMVCKKVLKQIVGPKTGQKTTALILF